MGITSFLVPLWGKGGARSQRRTHQSVPGALLLLLLLLFLLPLLVFRPQGENPRGQVAPGIKTNLNRKKKSSFLEPGSSLGEGRRVGSWCPRARPVKQNGNPRASTSDHHLIIIVIIITSITILTYCHHHLLNIADEAEHRPKRSMTSPPLCVLI